MSTHETKPVLHFSSPLDWEHWLEQNASGSPGVRLQLRKKGSTLPGFGYAEALDVALCFGWIDGQINAFDADFYLQSFTPRRPRSTWSQSNRDRIARLTAEGRMRARGITEVERARADGRWGGAATVPAGPAAGARHRPGDDRPNGGTRPPAE